MLRFITLISVFLLTLVPVFARADAGSSDMQIIRDQEIEQTLKTICTPAFQQAGVSPANIRFILIQNDELNAFVAGGQNIFIYTGLLLKTENPEEVAGVVAHETGHIALGHLFRAQETMDNLSVQSVLASVLGLAAAIGTRSSAAGIAVSQAGQGMALHNILSHSRTQESSADEAGVRFLNGADLPVTGFLSFMKKLADQELLPESEQSQYVQTHPLTQDRIDFLQHTVDEQARTGKTGTVPVAWKALHSRMKAKLLGYIYPDRALADRSETPDAQYARAIAWYRKGQTDKALALLENLMQAAPHDPYLYELKAQILFEAGRVEQSIPPYAKAVDLAPKAGLIRAAYGHALLETKENTKVHLTEAIKQLQLSLTEEPRAPQTHYFLAMAYGKLGQEGLSRLHLAEEYVMENKRDLAKREAHLALAALPKSSAGALRAQDILDVVERADKDKKSSRGQ
jgi:predicted Zn-dependent protease